jgi:hypothetical protein
MRTRRAIFVTCAALLGTLALPGEAASAPNPRILNADTSLSARLTPRRPSPRPAVSGGISYPLAATIGIAGVLLGAVAGARAVRRNRGPARALSKPPVQTELPERVRGPDAPVVPPAHIGQPQRDPEAEPPRVRVDHRSDRRREIDGERLALALIDLMFVVPDEEVASRLRHILRHAGFEEITPNGQRFDPTLHKWVGTRPAASGQDGIIAATRRAGWRAGDRFLFVPEVLVYRNGDG